MAAEGQSDAELERAGYEAPVAAAVDGAGERQGERLYGD